MPKYIKTVDNYLILYACFRRFYTPINFSAKRPQILLIKNYFGNGQHSYLHLKVVLKSTLHKLYFFYIN